MIIRHARPNDSKQIEKIAQKIKINYVDSQNNGFLVYLLSKEDYKYRIKSSNYFYVAEENNLIVGFLMCYDNKILSSLALNKKLGHEDRIVKYLVQQQTPFIFGDQIGILPEFAKRGVGKSLMNASFNDMQKNNIKTMYVGVLHKPVQNKASIRFCENQGFKVVEEVINLDTLVWGIYKLVKN